uniref:Uncharacterized protein n=1 Tax=Romanomermis culicivorax TaxID=13658 RepID=A0A915KW37_ROMCU
MLSFSLRRLFQIYVDKLIACFDFSSLCRGLSLFTAPVIRKACDNKDYSQSPANLQSVPCDRPSSSSSNLNFDSKDDRQIYVDDKPTTLTVKKPSVSNILEDLHENSADILGYLLTNKKNDKFAKSPFVGAISNSSSIDSAIPDEERLLSADARLLNVGNI